MTPKTGPRSAVRWAATLLALGLIPAWNRPTAWATSLIDRTGRFAIQWWTADDGLPDGPLRGIAFAPDGALFCASNRQIARFDGVSFQSLPARFVDDLHAAVGSFWSIDVDPEGMLWIRGTKGVARVEPSADRGGPRALSVVELPTTHVTGMAFLPGGPVFIGEGAVLAGDAGAVTPLPMLPDPGDVRWLYGGVDPGTGDLWLWGNVDNTRHLYRGRLRGPRKQLAVEAIDDDVAARIITMGFGPSGPMALLPDGIAVRRGDRWERLPLTLPDAEFRVSGKILEATDGTVWISSHNGLLACRDGGIETAIEGLPGFSSFTYQLVGDGAGGMWAACAGGLLAVRRTTLRVQPVADCRAVFERADGSLLVGVPGAVVTVPAGTAADAVPRRIATLPKDAIPTALFEDAKGRVWVGTQDTFLLRIEGTSVVPMTKADKHFRELRSIHCIAADGAGRIWIGTSNGLAVHEPDTDTFRLISPVDAPFNGFVVGLATDADGGVLAAALGNGITRHAPNGEATQVLTAADLPGRKSIAMRRDSQGVLWAGGDRGLVRVAADGLVTRFTTAAGLVADEVRQIEEDGAGRLWLALRDGHVQGVRLADLADVAARRVGLVRGIVLGPLDGIGENECVGHVARSARADTFAIALSNGVLRFDPTAVLPRHDPQTAPQIVRASPDGYAFRYASAGIHWGSPPLFQTRLEGVDSTWSEPAAAVGRDYAALPPGRHRFLVRTVAGETDREFPTSALEVVVPVPWYRTGWALGGVAAGVGGLAAVITREITRTRSRRRIAALERQQDMARERARIARDIHDSLGAGLTRMALMSDLARQANVPPDAVRDRLDSIYRSARGLARSVDEIVWAVNPRNDTVAHFITYVVNDVEEFARAGNLTLRLDVPDNLPDTLPLSTQVRHHLCLAVREILQNVLRHAQATHIEFTIVVDNGRLVVSVRDDGVGFAQDQKLAAEQDGLDNLRSRVAEVDGRVEVESQPGKGTLVSLTVPLDLIAPAGVPALRIFNDDRVSHAS